MIWNSETEEMSEGSGVAMVVPRPESVLFARDQAEAARYSAILADLGIDAIVGEAPPRATLGVPIFVADEQRDRAGEILAMFHTECAWDEDEDEEFDDDDDDDEDDEFFPDDADDDFDDDDDEEEEDDEA